MSHGNYKTYTLGFILSVVLTMLAYGAVVAHWFSVGVIIAFILLLAVIQLTVQLLFFLHLGSEPKPRLSQTTFWFMLMVLVIIVFGSLWIMKNLNYHTMMTSTEIIQDELPATHAQKDDHEHH